MGTHDASMIRAAEQAIRELEAELESRKAALSWLKELSAQVGVVEVKKARLRRKRLLGPLQKRLSYDDEASSQADNERETWAAKIDRVLTDSTKSMKVAQIVEALDAEGAFGHVKMEPAKLIRANLKRSKDQYRWRCRKRDGIGFWSAPAKKEQEDSAA